MIESNDVVIVGGGIAGASLACALARAGMDVRVLEASTEYADRVRGESMVPWGVLEARRLGVEDVLLDAGAHVAPVWKQYDPAARQVAELPVSMMVPGVEGTMNLRHPVACQALLDAATEAGATVHRGVRDVTLTIGGGTPGLTFVTDGAQQGVRAPLVVGADGRASTIRKQAGIKLHRDAAFSYVSGLLVDGLDEVPDDHDVLVSEGDLLCILFHQGSGRARAYVAMGESGQHRFAGPRAIGAFQSAWSLSSYPWSDAVVAATPAGPCATYPGDDTWTERPYAHAVVLIGDAAGHNDPIIGQGLSLAMRDARMVCDAILSGDRSEEAFSEYGAERMGRMKRLRLIADVMAAAHVEDADNRAARRAYLRDCMAAMASPIFPLLLGAFAGPETIPDDLLATDVVGAVRNQT